MAVVPPDDSINRIVSALGLENVRSLTISFAVNSAVAVVTEQYVTGNQMENLATAFEEKEWVLVPKRGALTPAEREAISVCVQDIRFEDIQATLQGLLDRTK